MTVPRTSSGFWSGPQSCCVVEASWNFLSEFSCFHADSDIVVASAPVSTLNSNTININYFCLLVSPAHSMWLLHSYEMLCHLPLCSGKQHLSKVAHLYDQLGQLVVSSCISEVTCATVFERHCVA